MQDTFGRVLDYVNASGMLVQNGKIVLLSQW